MKLLTLTQWCGVVFAFMSALVKVKHLLDRDPFPYQREIVYISVGKTGKSRQQNQPSVADVKVAEEEKR